MENEQAEDVEKTFCTNRQLEEKDIEDKWGNKRSSSEDFFYILLFGKKTLFQRQIHSSRWEI